MEPKPGITISDAENAIRQRFKREGFRGELKYDAADVIETERWWFIPCGWIGCVGIIVNKSDLYVNWLGSGSELTKELFFWGHDNGIYWDLVDFTFAVDTDRALVERLVARFKHMRPNARGVPARNPVPYRDSEIREAVASQFPTFKRHFVCHALGDIFRAWKEEGLRFTSCRSKEKQSLD